MSYPTLEPVLPRARRRYLDVLDGLKEEELTMRLGPRP